MHVTDPEPQLSVILPAYNEVEIIGKVIQQISAVLSEHEISNEILVIDDGSTDQTAAQAESFGAKVLRHPYNIGNGAAIKTGIRNAHGKVLVMLDADGQHKPEDIPRLLEMIGPYDMAVGARTRASDTAAHRDLANSIYNGLASYVCGRKIEDLTSGFRAIKTPVAQGFVYLLPNKFSYPTTITLATVRSGRALTYVPITTRKRVGKSKIRLLRDGSRFLLIILRIATFYAPLKVFIPASFLMFFLGFGYGLFKVLALGLPYGPTSAMLMTLSVVVFLIGLVSEQVAQLRFDRSEIFENGE
ncbi:MAG TPA: glycosyl transferase [Chloroflexi bacterium]|nr:glycosyl transferase [Chloroflexota bacterium]HBY09274.1 glycosyl transferase [Chloroflexota bacterium]